jgi:hypothetical protein
MQVPSKGHACLRFCGGAGRRTAALCKKVFHFNKRCGKLTLYDFPKGGGVMRAIRLRAALAFTTAALFILSGCFAGSIDELYVLP